MRSPRANARAEVIRCVRAAIAAGLPLDDLAAAFEDIELAARDLTNVIDDLPRDERPKGWTPEPALIDPDCRGGKHASCIGDPCECECHATGEVAP